jgi:hypothetical protein
VVAVGSDHDIWWSTTVLEPIPEKSAMPDDDVTSEQENPR